MKNKYRLSFQKLGAVCFLGHLDLLRVFQRAVKRANLPIAYSKGFNPHQLMSFALPLPLGVQGECEYIDIELSVAMEPDEIVKNLNESMPDGILITSARLMQESEKSSAAIVNKAIYDIVMPYDEELKAKLDEIIAKIMSSDEIIVEKKTKSGLKEANIRGDIFEITNMSDDENIALEMILSAGSMNNLKADVVIKHIYESSNISFDPFCIGYTRRELLL